jgi:hypothetical protein
MAPVRCLHDRIRIGQRRCNPGLLVLQFDVPFLMSLPVSSTKDRFVSKRSPLLTNGILTQEALPPSR